MKILGVPVLLASAVAFSAAQESPISVTLENYWISKPKARGLRERLGWAEIDARASKHFSFTNTYLFLPSTTILDETFVKYTNGETQWRTGRLRSGFGFSAWSDFYYNAIIGMPLVRSAKLQKGFGLGRFDTGLDMRSIVGPVEVQAGLVDIANGGWALTPRNLNYGVVRLQSNVGPLILGVSALRKVVGDKTSADSDAYGLDFRWTADHIQTRGELVRTVGGNNKWAGGSYVDVFYRPPNLYRTQLGVRLENLQTAKGVQQQYTAGVRQVLNQYLAATLNYGVGSGKGHNPNGWSFEISSSLHF